MKRKIIILITLITVFLGLWALYIEPDSLEIETANLHLNNWPDNFNVKIALLSDLHIGMPYCNLIYGYTRGHLVEDEEHLFVTSGIGNVSLPLRLGVTPEIALLNID